MDGWMGGWMGGLIDGWMDGWIDRWMDGQMDGQMDGWTESGSVATMFYKYVFHRVLNAPVTGNYTAICFSLGYQTFIYLFTVKRSLNA